MTTRVGFFTKVKAPTKNEYDIAIFPNETGQYDLVPVVFRGINKRRLPLAIHFKFEVHMFAVLFCHC